MLGVRLPVLGPGRDVFHDSKLPLWKWFVAVYLMVESKKGMSANQLKRTLGVSYKTAWYLCHRIRAAMLDESAECFTASSRPTRPTSAARPAASASKRESAAQLDNKTVVLGAVERGGKVRLRVAPDATSESVKGFLADVVADDAEAIYTDSHRSYRGIADHNTRHEYVDHSRDEWVRGDVHTNTVEIRVEPVRSRRDRLVPQARRKHLPAYLDEAAFRCNNRDNPFLFRDTLIKLVEAGTLTYANLVKN